MDENKELVETMEDYAEELEAKRIRVEDCLQTISLSSRHLLSLINNVLYE